MIKILVYMAIWTIWVLIAALGVIVNFNPIVYFGIGILAVINIVTFFGLIKDVK